MVLRVFILVSANQVYLPVITPYLLFFTACHKFLEVSVHVICT